MISNICTTLLTLPDEPVKAVHAAADEFVKMDPHGFGMTVIAISVVFVVLTFVYLFFRSVSKIYIAAQNKAARKLNPVANVTDVMSEGVNTEVSAAIAMALHMYRHNQHDLESLKITIQKVSKLYSPWSSKLYMMNKWPQK